MSRTNEEFKGKKQSCRCCLMRVVYTTDLCSECAKYKLKIKETVRLSTLEAVEKLKGNEKCVPYSFSKDDEWFELRIKREDWEELKQRGKSNGT